MNQELGIRKKIRKSEGFTLIELLIVVVIIGILSALLMSNFIGVRQRARDGQRKSDLRQIQAALEMYRADQGSYPSSVPNCPDTNPTSLMSSNCLSSTYMQKVPGDPLGEGSYNGGSYYYSLSGSIYILAACLENRSDSQGTSDPPGGSGCTSNFYYVLQNP